MTSSGGPKRTASRADATRRSTTPDPAAGSNPKLAVWLVGILVIAVVAVVLFVVTGGDDGSAVKAPSATDTVSVQEAVTSISDSVYAEVGLGDAANPPQATSDTLERDGKPVIAYVGAEFCPFCAAERWAIVAALSRFGTWGDLSLSHSSTTDTFPNTQTFSFRGATYTSDYLVFDGTEMLGNTLVDGKYEQLDTPADDVAKLFEAGGGSFPWVSFAGKYELSGATYSPEVLADLTATEIASQLSKPDTDVAKGAIGSANLLTAVICEVTGQQPAKVCTSSVITKIQAKLTD